MSTQKIELIKAETFKQRLLGLIPMTKLDKNKLFLLENCRIIHTLFMHFPIDVIFVDKKNVIIKLMENLKPYRIFGSPGIKPGNIYEAAKGFIKKYNLKPGDNIMGIL